MSLFGSSLVRYAFPIVALAACDSDPKDGNPDTTAPETVEETTGQPEVTEEVAVEETTPEVAVEVEPEVVVPKGLPILGGGTNSPAALTVETLLDDAFDLVSPRDVAFSPDAPEGSVQLYVADADMNMFIVTNPGTPDFRVRARSAFGADHFMPAPVSLAFGDNGRFATAHETDWITQDSTPADFMGPTLWSTTAFDGGWQSHMDMLHNSPNAVGIAWDNANAYWLFDGYHSSITYYDFQKDHGPGGEDHSDGIIVRWVEGQVKYVEGVTSDMQLDHATGKLYVADTGNGRVAVLDTKSGSKGGTLRPNYDGAEMYKWADATFTTLADLTTFGATQPSGLVLHDGKVFVTDIATSKIFAFELDNAGETQTTAIDWMDLSSVVPAGNLGAIVFDAEGRLIVCDVNGGRVLRLTAPQ